MYSGMLDSGRLKFCRAHLFLKSGFFKKKRPHVEQTTPIPPYNTDTIDSVRCVDRFLTYKLLPTPSILYAINLKYSLIDRWGFPDLFSPKIHHLFSGTPE